MYDDVDDEAGDQDDDDDDHDDRNAGTCYGVLRAQTYTKKEPAHVTASTKP